MDEAVLKADSAADKIGTAYLEALRDIQKRLDSIFRNFSAGISEAEAKRILKSIREPDVIKRLEKAVDRIEDKEKKALMLAEINAPAYKVRIDQLNLLSENAKTVCEKIGGQALSLMDRELYGITESTYYRSIFDTQKKTGLGFTFALLSKDRINEILLTCWSGKHYSERVWENAEMLAEAVEEILLKGFLTGKSSGRMANELQERMHSSYSRSLTLMRTEASFAVNSAELESCRENGAEKYRFVATLDLRTSEICRSLDGNEYYLAEACQGENCPPMHPRCRSTTIPVLNDEIMAELKRRSTDPVTGKPVIVSADMSYKEWYDKHVRGNAKAEVNEKAVRNLSSDKKQFERYRKLLGREMPKTLEEFQNIKYTDTHNYGLLKAQARKAAVDKSGESGIINIRGESSLNLVIDKFTPCLENAQTGAIVPTVFAKASKNELKNLKDWKFNWLDEGLNDSEIYKLCISGEDTIQGLVAVTDFRRDMAVYVNIAESAPHNFGNHKMYNGVGGHLFAIAAQVSRNKGYGGFVFMDAKNTELVEHYSKTLGAVLLGRPHPYRMFIDEENAAKLLKIYTFEEG